jgi:2-hydroxychromene-2-carboxylate isomerase
MAKAFYFDIVCPFAYMAFSSLLRHNIFEKKEIKLKPILLGGLFKLMESPLDPNKALSEEKRNYLHKDILRQAQYFGLKLSIPESHPMSTLSAMRLFYACDEKTWPRLAERLFSFYWQKNIVFNDELIREIAQEFNIKEAVNYSENTKNALKTATKSAFSQGVFGVPTLYINNRLYFGADRLALIEEELALPVNNLIWHPSKKHIDFYFDFASPYSFLAYAELKKAQSNNIKFNLIPVVLGAIMKERNVHTIPMLSAHHNKARYYLQDMHDWAQFRKIDFNFSPHFPLRSVSALRLALVEPKLIELLFNAAWLKEKDIGSEEVLRELLEKSGFDAQALIEKSQSLAIKECLRQNTDTALKRGLFGVPSFFIDDELFFGQDRFLQIAQKLKDVNNEETLCSVPQNIFG